MSETPRNPLEGLNELSLGPAWARDKAEKSSKKTHYSEEREYKPRGGGRRDDRRGGGNDRGDRRQGGGDRRQGGGGGRRNFDNNRGRRDEPREEIQPTAGVNVSLIPEKNAIQAICKEVHQVARVYPLYDIAQTILAERVRTRAAFEINEKRPAFYRCKFEDAIFLTKEEALRHFLQSDWRTKFVEESTVEIDPPKGNFQSVARCGISGEWLGPPNFHGYQTEIRRIHRERFAHMPFEVYSAKARTERSEEAVNEWLESMKTQTRWRILSDQEIEAKAKETAEAKEEKPATEAAPEATAEAEAAPTPEPTAEEAPATEEVAEAPEAENEALAAEATEESTVAENAAAEEPQEEAPIEAPEATEAAPEPEATPEIKWITDRAEVERAISAEVIEKAYHLTRKAKVSAAIPGKNLSPGLLVRLKGTGNHHRKHPAILIPVICKILEAEHMAVFKRKGKLFTGPARPHALAPDAVLAPRPSEMVKWIRENSPAKLEGLWKAVLPEGATAPPAEYAADLFWLLQQGHILLYTDDTLVVQEVPKPQEPKKPKQPKKKAGQKADSKATPDAKAVAAAETPAKEEAPTAEAAPATEEAPTQEEQPAAEVATAPSEEPQQQEDPVEIIADAIKDVAETVSEAASKLIDTVIDSTESNSEPSKKSAPESSPDPNGSGANIDGQ